MIIDAQAVKNCWLKIKSAEGADYFIADFYRNLFELDPEIQHIFPNDLGLLKTKLLNMLDNVINGIEFVDELEKVLIELGETHKNIGISKEMYDVFLIAVVKTAKKSSDYSITEEEIIAWEKAFQEISNIMLKAY